MLKSRNFGLEGDFYQSTMYLDWKSPEWKFKKRGDVINVHGEKEGDKWIDKEARGRRLGGPGGKLSETLKRRATTAAYSCGDSVTCPESAISCPSDAFITNFSTIRTRGTFLVDERV
ncbi:hypothetical protein RRG08_014178 [Elysia crispata]|uniref:Uncharacterized protein n=1 Tax=Elysia crispata TaxID=231223 RepID=A0AAE1A6M2_9GAST|nr:hypothetical protein RRG08_014178 [Elysia crispata]